MGCPSSSVAITSPQVASWLQRLIRYFLPSLSPVVNEQTVCFNRCCCYCLLLFIHCYSMIFHQSLSLNLYMHATHWIIYAEKSPSSSLGKPYDFSCIGCALPGCLACLCTVLLCFHTQHKIAGLPWPELPSYTDFCIYFGTLCFCFGYQFVKAEIRPPVLTNLTIMSGWLPFL